METKNIEYINIWSKKLTIDDLEKYKLMLETKIQKLNANLIKLDEKKNKLNLKSEIKQNTLRALEIHIQELKDKLTKVIN